MTLVLIVGGIDLSVGSVLALSGSVLGVSLVRWNFSLPASIALCLATGVICGLLNGWMMTRWNLPSFIVTLGMLEIARGGAYLITRSQTQYIGEPVERISEINVAGISLPFIFAVGLVVVAQITLMKTSFGRHLVACGANPEALRLSGVDPKPVWMIVFALCGVLTSLAAVFHCSRLSAADPNSGSGFELQAIAAVVIGGTSLLGGRGSVISSFLGVLIIAVLGAGLAQMGAQEPTKRVVTGCVIVAAVVVDHYRHAQR
jgi:ribose transport system permease protein